MVIRSFGHACFSVTDGKNVLLFDPFLEGNPDATVKPEEVKADYLLPSHGHSDHLGDAIPIAKRLGIPIIATYELAMYCARYGAEVLPLHIGGGVDMPFGRVKLTQALHGGGIVGENTIEYAGPPCGFLVTISGKNLYFAGDTGLFGDMKLIGENGIDVAILPIGDHFTMGLDDAVKAVELLQPNAVIPTHYQAFDPIRKDPKIFAERIAALGIRCAILAPGEEDRF